MGDQRLVFDALGKKIDEEEVLANGVPTKFGRITVTQRKSDGRIVVTGQTEDFRHGRYLEIRVNGGNQVELRLYVEES